MAKVKDPHSHSGRPFPVALNLICAVCEQPWDPHLDGKEVGAKVTKADCIRVLRAELARRPHTNTWQHQPSTLMAHSAQGGSL